MAKNKMPIKMISRSFAAVVIVASLVGCTKKKMRYESASMEPAIKSGEVIYVDLKAYSGVGPIRWDVVVFESPVGGGGHWASRVVGLPGETIDIRSGNVVIDGKEETLPPRLSIGGYKLPKGDLASSAPGPVSFPFKIPAGSYFVLGDNVGNALDSRYWGGLDDAKILGKVPGK
ncbi:signal peptidase I [Haloferula rosea]|uniref:Signal peptidase I n=1 Tax=Haloferula rosea TaxID=490093 RepID=A0A934RH13_9BACT|nr:signal peptidase I [Haloferula rosea]MBK1829076.1 signal peptidase I [Haloferula rosea]